MLAIAEEHNAWGRTQVTSWPWLPSAGWRVLERRCQWTEFFGPSRMGHYIALGGGDPWPALAASVWGPGFIAVTIALVNSSIAGANDARYVIYAWLAAGLLVLAYFLVTDRSRIARTGQIFDEPAIQAELHHETETSDQPDRERRRGAA